MPFRAAQTAQSEHLHQSLSLRDLVLAQVLCVVGSAWVGVAAKLGRSHLVFWLTAMALFYLPLAAVVIYLNALMPLEGGLYQWAKAAYGQRLGFLTAWNLWVYAVIVMGAITYMIPTEVAYFIGPKGAWIQSNRAAALAITLAAICGITVVAIRGLEMGKWLHNAGSAMILLAYTILLSLPLWAMFHGSLPHFEPLPLQLPKFNMFSLAVFGQMTIGALSGFEYVAILAGETRGAGRAIGRSVMISAPIIAVMFILGTSTVLAFTAGKPIDLIGPIPQTMRAALSSTTVGLWIAPFGIFLLIGRAVASSSLIFTGLTRLPMTAGWDNLLPKWFAKLHPVRRTPVNSILFVAGLVAVIVVLSTQGVGAQEANQLLGTASVALYGIAYIALFAIPLFGLKTLRAQLPPWLKVVSAAGLFASAISLVITVYPIVDVVSRTAFAAKILGVIFIANAAGLLIYRSARK